MLPAPRSQPPLGSAPTTQRRPAKAPLTDSHICHVSSPTRGLPLRGPPTPVLFSQRRLPALSGARPRQGAAMRPPLGRWGRPAPAPGPGARSHSGGDPGRGGPGLWRGPPHLPLCPVTPPGPVTAKALRKNTATQWTVPGPSAYSPQGRHRVPRLGSTESHEQGPGAGKAPGAGAPRPLGALLGHLLQDLPCPGVPSKASRVIPATSQKGRGPAYLRVLEGAPASQGRRFNEGPVALPAASRR